MAETLLERVLDRLRRRTLAIGVAGGVGWMTVAAVILILVCMWLDLIFELPAAMRIGLSLSALAAGVALLAALCRSAFLSAVPTTIAKRLDHVTRNGGRILSGVDLMLQPPRARALTAGLARIAVGDAAALAGNVAPSRAVPSRPMTRSFAAFVLLFLAVALLATLMPRMAMTQWLRFSNPLGDHPPYSPIVFSIDPGDVRVVYGDGLDIRATAEGATVERLELVIRGLSGQDEQSLPMFREPDGSWRATLASVTQPARYFVRERSARSHRFEIGVITAPRLENVRFVVTPPEYTNQPPYEGPLPKGGLSGLPGTSVQLRARSNRPLSGGRLEVSGGEESESIELTPAGGDAQEVNGAFTIREPGKIHVSVTDVDGQVSRDSFSASVALLDDQRPFVRLLEPRATSFATPEISLPVRIAAEDDYGVGRLELYRSLNDSRPSPLQLDVPEKTARFQPTVSLPLNTYGLKPGDVLKLFARVVDNDPAGAKGAESTVVRVQIISQADFERMIQTRRGMEVLQSKYRQAERRLERLLEQIEKLRKELEKLPPDSDLAQQHRDALRELSEQMQSDAREVQKAANFKLPYDVDSALTEELRKIAEQLAKAAETAAGLGAARPGKSGKTAEELEKLREALARKRKEFDQAAIQPLEHLAAIFPLKQDEARFIILYQRQRDLAERLSSLEGRDGEDNPQLKARMRDLEAEQSGIREKLLDLLDDIEDHATRLPEDPKLDDLRQMALEFAKAVRGSGADAAMYDAESGLAEFSGTRGAGGAQRAADLLEKFIKQCNGMGGEAGQCLGFNPTLSSCLGNTVQQMLAGAGMGAGMGAGSGSGYSAAGNNMNNVGLYGALPAMGDLGRRGDASGGLARAGRGKDGSDADRFESQKFDAVSALRAGGSGATHVPPGYRRRVGEYFRRIAEELDQP